MKFKLSANKKKVIVLASMVVLLVVAGTLNFVLNSNLPKVGGGDGDVVTTTFFNALRTTRESKRNEQIAYYDSIINNEGSTAEAIASAETAKLELAKLVETELSIESVIKSSGYSDVVVTLSPNSVHVTLNKAELDKTDMETVFNAVLDKSDYTTSQVTVIPYLEEK